MLRVIPNEIPTVEELGLPPQLNEIANERNGIVLVTGPTGSGKSTTLAAIINKMNQEKAIHIITIEDPIEYLHPNNKATINQREVGTDTADLRPRPAGRAAPGAQGHPGRRDARRRDDLDRPRGLGDRATSCSRRCTRSTPPRPSTASSASSPRTRSAQIRTRFSQSFKWIVSQRLVPKKGGGRIAICEILRANSRTREYVQEGEREGKSLQDAMEAGGLDGMQTFDRSSSG